MLWVTVTYNIIPEELLMVDPLHDIRSAPPPLFSDIPF
jgi:hypothetical protein